MGIRDAISNSDALYDLSRSPGTLLAFATAGETPGDNAIYYFVGIDEARFRKPVEPGDQLRMEVRILNQKRTIWKFKGTARVNGDVACDAELMCAANRFA
jgi:3-hydroxyacyl-[acyl-carrier-protein] dehydratase